jgi:cell division protease FtsH
MFMPKKNRVSYWKKELVDQLAVLMGGRCAEEIFVGDVSSGAKQDIEQATQLARSMVCQWGMSDKMGLVSYGSESDSGYYGIGGHHEKQYSQETAKAIDDEVRVLLNEAHDRARDIVTKYRHQVELMTKMLLKYETLASEDVEDIAEDKFSEETANARRKEAEELHKKKIVTPPPPPSDAKQSRGTEPPSSSLPQDIPV